MSAAMANPRHRSSDGPGGWGGAVLWRVGIGCAAALVLAACARSGLSSAVAASPADDQAAQEASQADHPADPTANMVLAVSAAGNSGSIAVKFRIERRPIIGMPVQIDVALIPDADAQFNRVHASLAAGDGLTLQSEREFDLDELQPGTAVLRKVTVVPQQTGVLTLDATLLLQSDKSSESRTYSIPLIVSDNSSS